MPEVLVRRLKSGTAAQELHGSGPRKNHPRPSPTFRVLKMARDSGLTWALAVMAVGRPPEMRLQMLVGSEAQEESERGTATLLRSNTSHHDGYGVWRSMSKLSRPPGHLVFMKAGRWSKKGNRVRHSTSRHELSSQASCGSAL
jgi:hypothetical protein